MAGSSTITAVLTIIITFTCFWEVCLTAPLGYPPDSMTREGIVREIVFEGNNFEALEAIPVRFVYRNPLNSPLTVNVTSSIDVTEYIDGQIRSQHHPWVRGDAESITIPAGGEFTIAERGYQLGRGCFFELEWEGLRRGVDVANGDVLARITTNSEEYKVGAAGGRVTFLYYNPTQYNVTFRVPTSFNFIATYSDGSFATGYGDNFWWDKWERTLPPEGSLIIDTFYFPTARVGEMTLTINDVTKTVKVVSRK